MQPMPMTNPTPNPSIQQQGQMIPLMMMPNLDAIRAAGVNPNSSVLYVTQDMKNMVLKSRDNLGYPQNDRTWELTETTPTQPNGDFATKSEVEEINKKLDQVLKSLGEFLK